MENQVLTIEQMLELIDMGVDVSNASMCWMSYPSPINPNKRGQELIINDDRQKRYFSIISAIDYAKVLVIPTFTLQDILDMLPKNIDRYIPLDMQSYGKPYNVINFGYWRGERLGWLKFCKDMHSTLNSAFELLKWCKQNNFI